NQIRNDTTMLAREPFPRSPEAGVNFIENEQRAVLITQFPQQRQKSRRRNVDATASLNRLDENCTNLLTTKNFPGSRLDSAKVGLCFRKTQEVAELPQLRTEWLAKMFAMRRVQRAVSETMIRAFERNNPATLCRQQRRLERCFHCFKSG